jgi:hypothetical protein
MTKLTTLAIVPLLMLPACGRSANPAGPGSRPDASVVIVMGPNGPLAAAPLHTERAILEMDPFDVPPGGEVYLCQNFKNPFGSDVDIVQSQSQMTPGSHHLFVFKPGASADAGFEGSVAPCSGLEFHDLVYGSQTSTSVTTYPAGVGQFVAGTQTLRLQAHYLNTGTDTIHAKVLVAFDVALEPVLAHAAWLLLNNNWVSVPPGASSASTSLSILPEAGDIKLLTVQSHMHRHGVHFAASLADGTPIYETDQWSEPQPKSFDPPGFAIAAGSTIDFTCDYQNDTGSTLTFGESASDNEMCLFGGLYYPAPNGKGIAGFTSAGVTSFIDSDYVPAP